MARRDDEKMLKDLADASVFLLDPMLVTGGSAAMAIEGLGELGARRVGSCRSSPRRRAWRT